jgi:hypothetical protein
VTTLEAVAKAIYDTIRDISGDDGATWLHASDDDKDACTKIARAAIHALADNPSKDMQDAFFADMGDPFFPSMAAAIRAAATRPATAET